MAPSLQTKFCSGVLLWVSVFIFAVGLPGKVAGQTGFRISSAGLTIDGYPQLSFNSTASGYYVLYRSSRAEREVTRALKKLSLLQLSSPDSGVPLMAQQTGFNILMRTV